MRYICDNTKTTYEIEIEFTERCSVSEVMAYTSVDSSLLYIYIYIYIYI